jgi:hypothetical protein
MEMDPHTLQQILTRIHQQMRCPQCGQRVQVDLGAIKVISDGAMLLQLKCDACNAYIVLQASLKGIEKISAPPYQENEFANASSTLEVDEITVRQVRNALQQSDGSFEKLFRELEQTEPSDADTQIV